MSRIPTANNNFFKKKYILFFVPTAFCDLQTMLQFIAPDYDSFIKESEKKNLSVIKFNYCALLNRIMSYSFNPLFTVLLFISFSFMHLSQYRLQYTKHV